MCGENWQFFFWKHLNFNIFRVIHADYQTIFFLSSLKNAGKWIFFLEFEFFSWVSIFLSFFGCAQKKPALALFLPDSGLTWTLILTNPGTVGNSTEKWPGICDSQFEKMDRDRAHLADNFEVTQLPACSRLGDFLLDRLAIFFSFDTEPNLWRFRKWVNLWIGQLPFSLK